MSLDIRETSVEFGAAEQRVLRVLDDHAGGLDLAFVADSFSFEAWDGDTYLGGVCARLTHKWVFVMLLGVSDAARGRGVGRRLMERVEASARAKGANGIWLDTYSFQAPEFYRKLGFEEFGRLDDVPDGHARHFFRKRLDG